MQARKNAKEHYMKIITPPHPTPTRTKKDRKTKNNFHTQAARHGTSNNQP
jgi:hypothetical protein